MQPKSEFTAARKTEKITLHLNAMQLYIALELGLINELPACDEDKILGRSKADVFSKLVATGQIGYFLFHTAQRYIRGLTLAQIEVAVFHTAFAAA